MSSGVALQGSAVRHRCDIAGLVDGYGAWDGLTDNDVGTRVVVEFPDARDGYRRRTRAEEPDLEAEQNVSSGRVWLDCLPQVYGRNDSRRGWRQGDGAVEVKAGARISVAWEIDALNGGDAGVSDLHR